ncbi:MAG: glycine/sarcosine/betaine reductase selenoprotein B family protein [Ilumatobacteraceae bacterium]
MTQQPTEHDNHAGGSDALVRRGVEGVEVFDFGGTACTTAPPLADARVAIVTTAGLRPDGLATWSQGQGFVVIDGDARALTLAHSSPNFDRTGLAMDVNVVYPVDRLAELAASGVIGSVASKHLSFMGAQPDHTLATLRLDSGPAAAALLKADGVDVVFLTPV